MLLVIILARITASCAVQVHFSVLSLRLANMSRENEIHLSDGVDFGYES